VWFGGTGTAVAQNAATPNAGMRAAAGTGNRLGRMDRTFMQTIAEGNRAEIRLGRLALQRASSPAVKNVAKMIITGHTQAQQSLQALAEQKDVRLPQSLNRRHRTQEAQLRRLSGAAFDRAYITGQVVDHRRTVALFQRELDNGTDSNVRDYAQRFLSDVQNHTKMLEQIYAQLQAGRGGGTQGAMNRH